MVKVLEGENDEIMIMIDKESICKKQTDKIN